MWLGRQEFLAHSLCLRALSGEDHDELAFGGFFGQPGRAAAALSAGEVSVDFLDELVVALGDEGCAVTVVLAPLAERVRQIPQGGWLLLSNKASELSNRGFEGRRIVRTERDEQGLREFIASNVAEDDVQVEVGAGGDEL